VVIGEYLPAFKKRGELEKSGKKGPQRTHQGRLGGREVRTRKKGIENAILELRKA